MIVSELMVADQHEDGVWMPVKDVEGKDTDIEVLIVGPYSETYQAAQRNYYRNNVSMAASVLAASEGDEKAADKLDGDDMMLLQAMWCVKDWRGLVIDEEGTEFECTEENKRQLLTGAPYIKADIYNTFRKAANFIKS